MWTAADRWVTLGALGGYFLLVAFWGELHSLVMLILHRLDVRVLSASPGSGPLTCDRSRVRDGPFILPAVSL